jgi:hypothetical protein
MSCFIHTTTEFNKVYSFLKDLKPKSDEPVKNLLIRLLDLEVQAYNERYNCSEKLIDIEFNYFKEHSLTHWDVLKFCDSVNYQVASGTIEQWELSKKITFEVKKVIARFYQEVELENDMYKENYLYDVSNFW